MTSNFAENIFCADCHKPGYGTPGGICKSCFYKRKYREYGELLSLLPKIVQALEKNQEDCFLCIVCDSHTGDNENHKENCAYIDLRKYVL